MALTAQEKWKEILIISDEAGRAFDIDCGWGVTPPVAYVASQQAWAKLVPPWLHDRRDEVIKVILQTGHVVMEK